MVTPWKIIEAKPEAAAALSWRRWLGPAFNPVAAMCLRETRRMVERMPCKHGCACNHRVRKRGAAWVGVCDCGEECDDIPLTESDVNVWEIDLPRLGRAVAKALDCGAMIAPIGFHRTIQVAAFGNPAVPVILTVQPEVQGYRNAVAHLLARLPKGFILLTPTKIGDAITLELLNKPNVSFYDLETNLVLNSAGTLQSTNTAEDLFAANLLTPDGRRPEVAIGPGRYLIRQESSRRRAGTQDRTLVSTWRFCFNGEELLMPSWVGTEYLVFLIRGQGKEYDASAITAAVRKSGAAEDGGKINAVLYGDEMAAPDAANVRGRIGDLNERDVIWDKDQIATAMRKIKALHAEIKEHENADDFGSDAYLELKRELEEQQDLLTHNAKQVSGKFVPKEYQKGTAKEKADVIRKHFRKLLDEHLRAACRPLYDHLNDKSTLVYGMKNCYRPKPAIHWEFQLKGGNKGT